MHYLLKMQMAVETGLVSLCGSFLYDLRQAMKEHHAALLTFALSKQALALYYIH